MEPIWMLFLNVGDHDQSPRDLTFYSFIEAFSALKLPWKSLTGVSRSAGSALTNNLLNVDAVLKISNPVPGPRLG